MQQHALRRAMRLSIAVAAASCASISAATAHAATPGSGTLSETDVSGAWQFPVPNWTINDKEAVRVDDIRRVGETVFIGGNFTIAANHAGTTETRTYLAAENAVTGQLTSFDPSLNGRVYQLRVSPDRTTLYVGGQFTEVDGQPRHDFAAFNIATGALDTAVPDLKLNSTVYAVSVSGQSVYLGGSFTSIDGQAHARLAKLTVGAGGGVTVDPDFTASASDQVRALVSLPATGRLVVGGIFKQLDGQSAAHFLGAVSMITGAPAAWASHPDYDILDLANGGTQLYAAMGGPGGTALAYTAATGVQAWYYKTDGNVQAVSVVDGDPVFGMHGENVATAKDTPMSEYGSGARIPRHKVFEISPSGVLQPWAPDISSTQGVLGVWSLCGTHGELYVGGDFTTVNGAQQDRFAIFPS
jgi:hypothetical protein